jgi:hypothetical protein
MDGDLYGGLELPKRTKREREEEKRTKPEESSSANDAAVKRLRAEKKPLDLAATVAKLEGYMVRVATAPAGCYVGWEVLAVADDSVVLIQLALAAGGQEVLQGQQVVLPVGVGSADDGVE